MRTVQPLQLVPLVLQEPNDVPRVESTISGHRYIVERVDQNMVYVNVYRLNAHGGAAANRMEISYLRPLNQLGEDIIAAVLAEQQLQRHG